MRKIDYDLNWGSHLPVMMKVMAASDGSVLELGAGLYSTPFFYWLCKDQKREFTSIESDFEWWKLVWNLRDVELKPELLHFIDELTMAIYISDWDNMNLADKFFDVVLIDHSPSRRRIKDIKALADKCNYMVVHDTQRNYKFCNYAEIYPLFKYRYDYKDENWDRKVPHTTVLSNFKDLSILE